MNNTKTDDDSIIGVLKHGQILELESQSAAVAQIQHWLNIVSAAVPEIYAWPETGYFGLTTHMNVRIFQYIFGLDVTGVVDTQTWELLKQKSEG